MKTRRLFVATHNAHKLSEISAILPGFDVVADDPGGVDENAPDFAGNALIKVRAISRRHRGEWCMADDSGLEVAALDRAPGVRSARFAGENCDMEANKALLLERLKGVEDRSADFFCAVALVAPDGSEHVCMGRCDGRILEAPAGSGGFGYDPLFVPEGFDRSFAELGADEKNAISHRGHALFSAANVIRAWKRRGIRPWLAFFRVVNLPTVPGDVFAGVAALFAAVPSAVWSPRQAAAAACASCAAYMFGLADNDICGMALDGMRRPLSSGEISLRQARVARALCWVAVLGIGIAFSMPSVWWAVEFALLCAVVLYNRTKRPALMGAARGLNVLSGAAAFAVPAVRSAAGWRLFVFAGAVSLASFAYIATVTRLSEGEETDGARRRLVGSLVGAVVYLQLVALLAFALLFPASAPVRTMLVAGAVALVALRLLRRLAPGVSAS